MDALKRLAADLTALTELFGWAHTDGYWPTGPTSNPGRRHGDTDDDRPAGSRPGMPGGADYIPGARGDFGVGSNSSRQAYQAAIRPLRRAELYLVVAAAGAVHRVYPRHLKDGPHEHRDVLAGLTTCRSIVADLTEAEPLQPPVRRAIRMAAADADRAWRVLNAAFERGAADPDTQATGEPACRICGIRPQADRKGGRCSTCHQWKVRNGHERPRKLDQADVKEARKAKARRRARGEDFGAA